MMHTRQLPLPGRIMASRIVPRRKQRPIGLAGEVAERLESLRKSRRLTPIALADAAGVSLATIVRIERGRAGRKDAPDAAISPGINTIAAIAKALRMSPAEFLADVPTWNAIPER